MDNIKEKTTMPEVFGEGRKVMEIRWEAEDGYAGPSAPQTFDFDEDEVIECDTVEEAMELIDDATQNNFLQTVSWGYLNHDEIRSQVEELLANKEEEDHEDDSWVHDPDMGARG